MTPGMVGPAAAADSARVATIFQEARLAQQQGETQRAEARCASVLAADPRHYDAWHLRGLLALQSGRDDEGIEWLQRSLALNPNQPAAHSNLGNAWLSRGEAHKALGCFESALRLKPDYLVALFNRGNALRELGRLDAAMQSYDQALCLDGAHVASLNNRGLTLLGLDRPAEALAAFERVVQLDPAFTEGERNRAAALLKLERPAEALAVYERLRTGTPQDVEVWCGHGCAMLALSRLEDARASFTRALELDPAHLDSLTNRGHALQLLHQPAAALADYERVLARAPDSARALNNSGNALMELGKAQAALARYERALRLKPTDTDTLYNRAAALHELKRYRESAQSYEELLRIASHHDYALGGLFHLRMDYCNWSDYAWLSGQLEEALRSDRRGINPRSVLLCDSPALQLRCAQRFAREKYAAQETLGPCRIRTRGPGAARSCERLRVAYVSADFGEHPVSHLLVGVLERHDRERFEVIGVSLRTRSSSAFQERLRAAFDRFIEAGNRGDEELARLLRSMEIDVAIDLMGYTHGLRLGTFAHRVAPVQATYLGYAGTLGAPYMDYLIADAVVIPPGDERFYSESVVRLPHCYLPNDDKRTVTPAPTRDQAGLPASGAVLCAFTNAYKINPLVFAVWMRLLRQIAGSVLWLRAAGEAARENLEREAEKCGVERSRLVFAPRVAGMAEHLGRQALADLYLDTQPYNAHSTACDALWAGVPVLTCAGRSFASRVAASALSAVGLPELITHTLEEYEAKALELLREPEKLRGLREKLARQRLSAPLFDTRGHALALESAYLTMHERAVRGARPTGFSVAPDPMRAPPRGVTHADLAASASTVRDSAESAAADVTRELRRQGHQWLQAGVVPRALECFERALAVDATDVAALIDRGVALQELGRPAEAIMSYDRALELRPGSAPALVNRSNARRLLGRLEEALADLESALHVKPAFAEALNNRGNVLRDLGRLPEALASFEAALALKADFPTAHTNRAQALLDLKRPAEALPCFEAALRALPEDPEALFGRASALLRLEQRPEQALADFDRAAAQGIDRVECLIGEGAALAELQRHADAARCFAELLTLAPERDYARGSWLHSKLQIHDWTDLARQVAELERRVRGGERATHPQSLLSLCDAPELQLRCAEVFAHDKYARQRSLAPCAARARAAGERLRLAYVSADFGDHPVSHLLVGVLERHDRARCELIGVSLREHSAGPFEQRVRRAFDRFIEVGGRSDAEVARVLRRLEVDVAVDLMGYTQGLRLGIFAHRAAPVQASWLGFAGTTGAPYMDYLIADAVVIPPGDERFYSESVVRLPHCYLPNDDKREIAPAPTRGQAGLPDEGVVLCAFTNAYKINPPVFAVWMRLLREIPGSVLWLRGMGEAARGNLQREAESCGVERSRLVFAPHVAGMAEHLGRQSLADLYLDTQPYNAHSTACDALWAGVPVLTCAGRSFASRVAASALSAVGLPELITQTLEEYEAKALELLRAPDELRQLREKLSRQRLGSALFDTARFTRHLEHAYLTMHERAVRGESPSGFSVTPVAQRPEVTSAVAREARSVLPNVLPWR